MNREIKFKYWYEGKMSEIEYLQEYVADDYYPTDWINEAIWLQSTGVTDKNGIEICEGDYLYVYRDSWKGHKDSNGHEIEKILTECFWDNHNLQFSIGSYNFHNDATYEVVGNKFENPGMLENEGIIHLI